MWLIELFRAVEQALGKREIIAEDLGYMSETVRQLVRDSGFPGMKVLEFAFDSRDTGSASDYLPHNYPVNSVAYTGTHDNETLVSDCHRCRARHGAGLSVRLRHPGRAAL